MHAADKDAQRGTITVVVFAQASWAMVEIYGGKCVCAQFGQTVLNQWKVKDGGVWMLPDLSYWCCRHCFWICRNRNVSKFTTYWTRRNVELHWGNQTSEENISDVTPNCPLDPGEVHISTVSVIRISDALAWQIGDKVDFLIFCLGQTTKTGDGPWKSGSSGYPKLHDPSIRM